MEKVRIGNDLRVNFSVYRNGEPESFDGATNISTKIVNESYNKTIAHTYSIVGNVVQFEIDALELKQCGKCRVFISYAKVGDYTVDSPAFELVQHTEDTGGTEVIGIEIVKINISGDIGINRDGASAYEVWESYPGNEGKTIEQYFEWLRENPTKIDLDGLNSEIDKLHFKPDTLVQLANIGDVRYSPESKTLEVKVSDTVSIQLGQEMQTRVKNDESIQINNGQMVYINSAVGANPLAKIASTSNSDIAQRTFGMATENIPANGFGAITTEGLVRDINTSAFPEGSMLWLGANGNVTNIEPTAPTSKISVGMVLRSNANNGIVYVKIRAIARNQKLSDVYAPTLTGGDVLRWNNTTLRFEAFNITTALGSKVDTSRTITAGNGLTGGGNLTEDRTININPADDSLTVTADNIKVNTNNTLTSTSTTQPLSANQGKVLNEKIGQVETDLNTISLIGNRSYVELNGGEYVYENYKIGGYDTTGSVVNTNVGTDVNVKSFVVNCYAGDKFKLKGVGGYSVALWCFTDLNYNKLTVAAGGASANDLEITAKQNGYLFINFNSYNSVPHYFKYIGRSVSKNTDALMMDVYGSQILWTEYVIGQRYATNVGVGNVVNLTTAADNAKCAMIPCLIDDEFIVSGKGAETARLWCFVDSEYVCRSVATGGLILNGEKIKSNANGYLIINFQNTYIGTSELIVIKKSIKAQISDESIAIQDCGDYSIIAPSNIPTNLSTPNDRGQVNRFHTYADFLDIYYNEYITNLPQSLIQQGYSVGKRSLGKDSSGQYDIYEYDFRPKNYSKIIMLSAGMNALETGGIYGLSLFLRDIIKTTGDPAFLYLRENVRIKVIPIICPWAFDQDYLKYANFNNVNINRNFDYNGSWSALTDSESLNPNSVWAYKGPAADSESETKILKNWVNANGKSSSLWLDCHQDIGGSISQSTGANMILAYGGISSTTRFEWNKIKSFYSDMGKTLIQTISGSYGSYPKIAYSFDVCGCPSAMIEQWPSIGAQYGSTGVNGGANEGINCDEHCLINYILMIRGAVLGALRKPISLPTRDTVINSIYQVYLDLVGK